MPKKSFTREEFIEKAIAVHGRKYSYDKVEYINSYSKVKIICNICQNEFMQRPRDHIHGSQGCPMCLGKFKKTSQEFIDIANKVHNFRYDYSLVDYINNYSKVKIICKSHGEFKMKPADHIHNKQNCPKCKHIGYSKISIQFLNDLAQELNVNIQHAENSKEHVIHDIERNKRYYIDGYAEVDNKRYAFEFLGSLFHSDPRIYNPEDKHPFRKIPHKEVYEETFERMNRIKALGYEVIYIWEQDYRNYLRDLEYERKHGFEEPELKEYYVKL